MKKLREMKKNNKGFSLVELIVVIAIMVVLIAVLGSTILGYIEKSKYSKDISALDSINTAVKTFVADPSSDYTDGAEYTLDVLISNCDKGGVISPILAEVFDIKKSDLANSKFHASSDAFENVTLKSVKVQITKGAVYIYVPASTDSGYAAYEAGTKPAAAAEPTTEPTT